MLQICIIRDHPVDAIYPLLVEMKLQLPSTHFHLLNSKMDMIASLKRQKVDLILIDLDAEPNSFNMMKQIHQKLPEINFIVVTSNSPSFCNYYTCIINKPFSAVALIEQIRLLSHRKGTSHPHLKQTKYQEAFNKRVIGEIHHIQYLEETIHIHFGTHAYQIMDSIYNILPQLDDRFIFPNQQSVVNMDY